MLGIEDYGSDNDSDRSGSPQPLQAETSKQPPKTLPGSATTLKARVPKKITIALPTISAPKEDAGVELENDRPVKKRKTGAGASSLLTMLPTPKENNPTPPTQRVLGGGTGRGLKFHTQSSDVPAYPPSSESTLREDDLSSSTESSIPAPSTLFRPTSLARGKKNISLEETNINEPTHTERSITVQPAAASRLPAQASDFFSFSSLSSISISSSSSSTSASSTTPSSLVKTFSAAPELPSFEPPEPTPTDSYPGYYQLPSGKWAAYDVEYYNKFMKKWEREYNAHVRALEKGAVKGFEGLQNADVEEIDALKEMEKAKKEIQEREEKKAVTLGAGGGPIAPKMNISASKMSGVARSRHQLSTLLKEAYENREALEERIAQGKRNRKEAGNKYGF